MNVLRTVVNREDDEGTAKSVALLMSCDKQTGVAITSEAFTAKK